MSIKPDDLSDINIVIEKALLLHSLFATLEELENVKVTETHKENLAGKRHEKRNLSSRTLSSEVKLHWSTSICIRRRGNPSSISDPNTVTSNSGGTLFHAAQELESQLFRNQLCYARSAR